MSILEKRVTPKRLAVAAAEDDHVLEAVFAAREKSKITPALCGDQEKVKQICGGHGISLDGVEIYDIKDPSEASHKAAALVSEGKADFIMRGNVHTGTIIRAIVDKRYGLVEKGRTITLLSMTEIPSYHKIVSITDGGIVANPTFEQKIVIIENAVRVLRNLGYDKSKVAVLTAIETVNPKMQETVDATELKRMNQKGEIADCIIEGPISMDVAFDKDIAMTKNFSSPVVGDVDIMVVPNVLTGNIVGKAIMVFGKSTSILMAIGAKCPLVITSRGATAKEKYQSILLAAAEVI